MLSKRIVAIAGDKVFARRLAAGLMAAGGTVETAANLDELAKGEINADLVVLHVTTQTPDIVAQAHARMKKDAAIIAIIDHSSLEQVVDVMKAGRVAAVLVADGMRAATLSATASRLLYGDVFGLEKALPWGVKIYSQLVGDYQEKSVCIAAVSDFATAIGVRRKYRESVEQCLDELLMNALYDAPVDSDGKQLFADVPTKTRISLRMEQKAIVQYACEGDTFALSVRDSFGALKGETVVKYLDKCLHSEQQIDRKTGGAGLGLYIISNAATQFLVNIYPGVATEVVCTFDLTAPKVQLKEFGVFHERIDSAGRLVAGPSRLVPSGLGSRPGPAGEPLAATALAAPPAPSTRGLTYGLVAAIVLLLTLIGIVAYPRFVTRTGAIAISTSPPGAVVEIDGRAVGTSGAQPLTVDDLPLGQKLKVSARLDGYEVAELIAEPSKDRPAPVQVTLTPRASVVHIESDPPGAAVFLAGKELGITPLTVDDLAPGSEHEVVLRKMGYADLTRAVKVPGPGREATVSLAMSISTDFGSVKIESEPPGAQVLQNGELLAGMTTPVNELIVQVGKPYTFTLKLPGYQPLAVPVQVERGERGKLVSGTLAAGGGLTVEAIGAAVPDVRVTVKNQPQCSDKALPLRDCPLPKGKHAVKLSGGKIPVAEDFVVEIRDDHVAVSVPLGLVEADGADVALVVPGVRRPTGRVALREGKHTVTVINTKTNETAKKQITVTAGGTVKVGM
jgi:hypothetical protein